MVLAIFYWICLVVAVALGVVPSFSAGGNRIYGLGWIAFLIMGLCVGIRVFPLALN